MTEAKFSFTTKVDGDLLTARGDTAEEFSYSLGVAKNLVAEVRALQRAARDSDTPTHDQAVASEDLVVLDAVPFAQLPHGDAVPARQAAEGVARLDQVKPVLGDQVFFFEHP